MLWKMQHSKMIMYHHTNCFLHEQQNEILHHGNNRTDYENDVDQKAKRTKRISHEITVPRSVLELVNPSNIIE